MQNSVESYAFVFCVVIVLCPSLCQGSPGASSRSKDAAFSRIEHICVPPPYFNNVEKQAVAIATHHHSSSTLRKGSIDILNQLAHRSLALAERNVLSDSMFKGYRSIWKSYQVFVNSTEALSAQQKMYAQLKQSIMVSWKWNDSTVFAGQILVVYGALQMRFHNLPRNAAQARELVLRSLLLVSSYTARSLMLGAYELVVIAHDTVFQIWLGIGELVIAAYQI